MSDGKKREKIGAFWKKEGPNGKFLSGEIELGDKKIPVVIFPNGFKEEGSRQPDYNLYKSEPRRQQSVSTGDIGF